MMDDDPPPSIYPHVDPAMSRQWAAEMVAAEPRGEKRHREQEADDMEAMHIDNEIADVSDMTADLGTYLLHSLSTYTL